MNLQPKTSFSGWQHDSGPCELAMCTRSAWCSDLRKQTDFRSQRAYGRRSCGCQRVFGCRNAFSAAIASWLCERDLAPAVLLIAILAISAFSHAQSGSSISYEISLTSPEEHLLNVQITLPPGLSQRELQLPVWNALYQIRDFAQYINWIRAKDRSGKPLSVHEINSSRWQIEGAENGALIEYEIYADLPSPFGAQLNQHHAFFNFAEILMYPVEARSAPTRVTFTHVPTGWQIATPLASLPDKVWSAENYDRLVDSPIEIGDFRESDFDESGGHFRVIVDADPADYDMQKLTGDLRKIVAAAISWMNDRPFETYMFIYHFPRGPAGGGMEHAYSTAIDLDAELLKMNPGAIATVTAHEFFHLWNVKRIRPQTLEPVDYTKENYTRALWFSEGVTSTVENTIELRAGLVDEKQFLYHLGDSIDELERRPAHLTQSAEGSSIDAWLEGDPYYRRPDRSVSYYNKGELLGIVLDLAVRQATNDHASLREVFQWMNANFAKQKSYFHDSEGVRQAAEAVSHADFAAFFTKYVAGTEEIPWDDFFRYVGLQVEQVQSRVADPGFVASRNFDGPMTVASVTPGSDAEKAGLHLGDTILELQGKTAGLESRQDLARLHPGDALTVKVRSRRGSDREVSWNVGSRQEIFYQVKDLDSVTPDQRAHRAAWLKGEAESQSEAASSTR
jgi:predicted metalloprotease with PDZ domain